MKKLKTKKAIREVMKRHLCWGGLQYCCKGRCASKEACLKELGLTTGDFKELKKQSENLLFKKLKGGND